MRWNIFGKMSPMMILTMNNYKKKRTIKLAKRVMIVQNKISVKNKEGIQELMDKIFTSKKLKIEFYYMYIVKFYIQICLLNRRPHFLYF